MIECNDEASSVWWLLLWSAYSRGNSYIKVCGEIVTTVSTSSKCCSVVTYAVGCFLLQIKTKLNKNTFHNQLRIARKVFIWATESCCAFSREELHISLIVREREKERVCGPAIRMNSAASIASVISQTNWLEANIPTSEFQF